MVKLGRVQVICPACGQQVEAVATDGRVKGYCTVAEQYVDFLIETQRVRMGRHPTAEHKAKLSAAHMGKHHTVEAKDKISAANMGKHRRHHTVEAKAKISAANMGKHSSSQPKGRAEMEGD